MLDPPARTALVSRELPPAADPLAAFESLRALPYPWLLDSALPSPRLGRFSLLGADPYLVVRARGGLVELECRRAARPGLAPGRRVVRGDPFDVVSRLLPTAPPRASSSPAPFVGGAVGYLGYELAACLEAVSFRGLDDLELPDAYLLFVDRAAAFDHVTGRFTLSALGFADSERAARARAERCADEFAEQLRQAVSGAGREESRRRPATLTSFFDESAYAKAVDAAKQKIAAGDVYQACLTHRLEREYGGDAWALYRRLRRLNPAPFACFFELPEVAILSSSPERFLRLDEDRNAESRPIKGTRPRGRDPAEDAAYRRALASSAKDRAENLMIVDLVRNDLGRVCETGSVDVPELMAIEDYASVFQMVSTVRGRLRPDRDALDLVRAAFPPGSMTGAPKIAAMRILERLEPVRRGVYSGAIGYFDARGGADLSVAIRIILLRRGRAYLHAGGGIVADSDPVAEYRETLDKARPLLAALGDA